MANLRPVAVAAAAACVPLALGLQALHRPAADPVPQAAGAGPVVDTVLRVVDGESFDVQRGGQVVRVRLLDVDAPDLAGDGSREQCGAAEAKAHLEARLPAGTPVSIRYGELQMDWYQRELGWVTTPDRRVVNVDVVRDGMGAAWAQQPATEFLTPLREAQRAAATSHAGLYEPRECSLETRVDAARADLADTVRRAQLISEVSYERSMRTLERGVDDTAQLREDLILADSTAEGRMLGEKTVQGLRRRFEASLTDVHRTEARVTDAEEARVAAEIAAAREREARAAAREAAAKRAAAGAETSSAAPTPEAPTPTPAATSPTRDATSRARSSATPRSGSTPSRTEASKSDTARAQDSGRAVSPKAVPATTTPPPRG